MSAQPVENSAQRPSLRKAAKSRFFYGYVVVAASFGVWLIGWGANNTFGVFFRPVLTDFGWSRADAILGYSVGMTVQAALSIITGWLTDKLGPRIVVIVFGSFLGLSYLLLSQVSALWQFQINYALVGAIGLSPLTVPLMATVARWFVKRRGLMTGIAQAGVGAGGLIFAPFAAWLISTHGWRSAYIVIGIITLVGIIVSGLFLRHDPRDVGQLPDGASGVAPETKKQSESLQTAWLSLRRVLGTSQFWLIAGLYFSFGFCRSTFLNHIPAHVQDLGFSLADGANVLAVLIGVSMIGRIGMGRVSDIIGSQRAFMISYAITTAILIWGLVAKDLWGFYLFALFFGFGWGAQGTLTFSITSEVFGLLSLGSLMGVLYLISSAAGSFGSYFAGYFFDVFGNYQLAFLMGIAVSLMGIILARFLKPFAGRS